MLSGFESNRSYKTYRNAVRYLRGAGSSIGAVFSPSDTSASLATFVSAASARSESDPMGPAELDPEKLWSSSSNPLLYRNSETSSQSSASSAHQVMVQYLRKTLFLHLGGVFACVTYLESLRQTRSTPEQLEVERGNIALVPQQNTLSLEQP
jgi:hypothetical protein